MIQVEIFKNERFGDVRVANVDGVPMFCATDIAKALGYKEPKQAVVMHCKSAELVYQPHANGIGGTNVKYIKEADVYRLIMKSELPSAADFQDWVCEDVLPTIRKHGMYATDDTIDKILNDPDFGIKLLTTLKEERSARIEAERKNAILMHVNKTYTATEIAKELNMKSAKELNSFLAKNKIQYKVGNTWVFYSDYSNKGYEEIKQETLDNGHVVYHRKFTQLGREFILNLFSKNK